MKKFVQYGAGNIGRGFIGQLFSKGGYEVNFIDVDMNIINTLNSEKRYPVKIVSGSGDREIWVENVKGIDGRNSDEVISAIASADMMATAIGVNVLPRIVPLIAQGIRARKESGNKEPLNIIICENLIDADKFLHKLLSEQFNEEENKYFEENVGLVEASIGKMVPVMTEEQKKDNILRVNVEKYDKLPVDKAAFKGEIPEIPNLYPYTPFELYIKRKLFVHNMGHALVAYLGNLKQVEYIWQSVEDPAVKVIAQRAMEESGLSLVKRFNIPANTITDHIAHLLGRFGNVALKDTVARVGNDIRRKLSPNDRFIGAVNLCGEENIPCVYIPIGIAAALFFDDVNQVKYKGANELIDEKGLAATLEEICGIKSGSCDCEIYELIKSYYEIIERGGTINDLLSAAEKIHMEILESKNII